MGLASASAEYTQSRLRSWHVRQIGRTPLHCGFLESEYFTWQQYFEGLTDFRFGFPARVAGDLDAHVNLLVWEAILKSHVPQPVRVSSLVGQISMDQISMDQISRGRVWSLARLAYRKYEMNES